MKTSKKAVFSLSLGMMVLGVFGCAEKKVVVTEVPSTPAEDQSQPIAASSVTPIKPFIMETYVVKKGDTLWAISRQVGIYSDSFEWPLIFKTDRDQIQDPDQITPGQILNIQKGQTSIQVQRAIKLASDTPVFVSHVEPRSPLPVDYF